MTRTSTILAALLGAACSDPPPPPKPVFEAAMFPSVPSRQLDLLVVMDDSDGLENIRNELGNHANALFDALAVVDGALPDLHIGLTTSDMGTTSALAPREPGPMVGRPGQGGCAGFGKDGALLLGLNTSVVGTFLVDEDDGTGTRRRNYDGELAEAFRRQMTIGSLGCSFEQHLRGMERALQRPDHADFFRPDANLAVLIVADEDDCSVNDVKLFSANEQSLGALQSFRCTQHGNRCAEDLGTEGPKTECVPREDSPYVTGIQPFIDLLAARKPRERLLVAGVVPDPAPLVVELRAPPGRQGALIPAAKHVCMARGLAGIYVADPAPRLAAFIDHFASHGRRISACAADRQNVLALARAFKQLFGVACLDPATLADQLAAPGTQPACEVLEIEGGVTTRLPPCPSAEDACFEILPDAVACPEVDEHLRVNIVRTTSPSPLARIEVVCEARLTMDGS